MADLLRYPTTAVNVGSGTIWQNTGNALSDADGDAYSHITGAAGASRWLALGALDGPNIAPTRTIEGISVTARAGTDWFDGLPIGASESVGLEFGLSFDGATVSGSTKRISMIAQEGLLDFNLGGVLDLWGNAEITPAQANSLVIMVRRPATGAEIDLTENATLQRRLESLKVSTRHTGASSLMSDTLTVLKGIQFGIQTDPQTAVATTRRMMASVFHPTPQHTVKTHHTAGRKLASARVTTLQRSNFTMSGMPCYNEYGWWRGASWEKPVSVAGAGAEYIHTSYWKDTRISDTFMWTTQHGNPDIESWQIPAVKVSAFNMEFSREDMTWGGTLIGDKMTPGITMSEGADDVQTFVFTGASGGTVKLKHKGQITAAVTWSGTAATFASSLQTALRALSNMGVNGVTVAGSGTGPWTMVITFDGADTDNQFQPLIEVHSNNLTGGTITRAHTTPGGINEDEIIEMHPDDLNIYINETLVNHDALAGLLEDVSKVRIETSNRHGKRSVLKRSGTRDKNPELQPEMTIALQMEANSAGVAFLDNLRSRERVFVRLEWISDITAGSTTYRCNEEYYCEWGEVQGPEDNEGIQDITYNLHPTLNREWGYAAKAEWVNLKANYTS